MTTPAPLSARVINYDEGGYDYRKFWQGRDYENWAEARLLRKLIKRVPQQQWIADLGGGFGRNIPHYINYADHVVLVDYSWTNLTNAEQTLLAQGASDRIFLLRGDIYHLPFRNNVINLGSTVRVIHHLSAIDDALREMSRVLGKYWILDVPIKNHLLAKVRASLHHQGTMINSRDPQSIGTPAEPFYNFNLQAIRDSLHTLGWQDELVASVANFRRWERVVPGPLRTPVRPFVYGMEVVVQKTGRGWWGPAQFLWLEKQQVAPILADVGQTPDQWKQLASILQCPNCKGELQWTSDEAVCRQCGKTYARKGAIWDFVAE